MSIKRQRSVPAGSEDVTVLAADEPKREEFGLVLTDDSDVIGAAKLSYDDDSKRTRVDGIVDGSCRPVRWSASDTPAADPSPVAQHSHLRSTLRGNTYDLELKPNDATFEMELHLLRE